MVFLTALPTDQEVLLSELPESVQSQDPGPFGPREAELLQLLAAELQVTACTPAAATAAPLV